MKSFKRMVVVSSMLLTSLLFTAHYAGQKTCNSGTKELQKNSTHQQDVLETGYVGLITGLQLQLSY